MNDIVVDNLNLFKAFFFGIFILILFILSLKEPVDFYIICFLLVFLNSIAFTNLQHEKELNLTPHKEA